MNRISKIDKFVDMFTVILPSYFEEEWEFFSIMGRILEMHHF